jgi:hypothetical protein
MKMKAPNGELVEAETIEVVRENPVWSRYELQDGSVIRVKPIVAAVFRTAKYTEAGEPIYIVRYQNVVAADVAESLKRLPG